MPILSYDGISKVTRVRSTASYRGTRDWCRRGSKGTFQAICVVRQGSHVVYDMVLDNFTMTYDEVCVHGLQVSLVRSKKSHINGDVILVIIPDGRKGTKEVVYGHRRTVMEGSSDSTVKT